MTTTPWARFVTPQPEPFGIVSQHGASELAMMTKSASGSTVCRVDRASGQIVLAVSGRRLAPVAPYRVALSRLSDSAPPIIDAHPFLLLHLLSTRQVDPDELLARAFDIRGNAIRWTGVFTKQCDLLSTLKLSRMAIRLGTNFNLAAAKN